MDEPSRKLERAWAAGDREAARLLTHQRLRSGALSEENVLLAVRFGHPIACALRPEAPRGGRLVELIAGHGLELRARAAFAAIRHRTPEWYLSTGQTPEDLSDTRRVIDALADCISNPSPQAAEHLDACLERLPSTRRHLLWTAGRVARCLLPGARQPAPATSLTRLITLCEDLGPSFARTIHQELGDWLLGLRDPITHRVDVIEVLLSAKPDQTDADVLALRSRIDDLTSCALQALACLGDAAAIELVGEVGSDLRGLLSIVTQRYESHRVIEGRGQLNRLAIAVAEDRQAAWEARHPKDTAYADGLTALRAYTEDPGPESLKTARDLLEVAYRGPEPPWALYRAGMAANAPDVGGARRATLGALRWALADRRVEARLEWDYQLVRQLDRQQLDDATRSALGLDSEDALFSGPEHDALRDAIRISMTPYLLRSQNPRTRDLEELRPTPAAPLAPRRRRWETYTACPEAERSAELVERAQSKQLDRQHLRLADYLGHAPAGVALTTLGWKRVEPQTDPLEWCIGLWSCGQEPWARAVEVACRLDGNSALGDVEIDDWFHPSTHWFAGRAPRGPWAEWFIDRDTEHKPTEAEVRHHAALASAHTRRRGKKFYESAPWVGTPAMREAIADALVPWSLGFLRSPAPAEPMGVLAYDASQRYEVGERIHHPELGVGEVTLVDEDQVLVEFPDHGLQDLPHGLG